VCSTLRTVIERSPVLLTDFCSQLREKSRHLPEGGCTILEFNVDFPAGTVVWIDPKKLHRALLNLIKNACEVLSLEDVKASRVTVTMAEREGQLQIEVTDNGPGIPPEIQIRLFEPFVTYGKSNGTGLGLAIVRQIIEAHDGTLTVEGTPAGAAFKMRLPQPQTGEAALPG
jgi:signal transduction histidine kinase